VSRKGPTLTRLTVPEELRPSIAGPPATDAPAPIVPLYQRILLFAMLPVCGLLAVTGLYLLAHSIYAAFTERTADHYLSHLVFVGHIALGLALLPPATLFVIAHIRFGQTHPNLAAARRGYALASAVCLVALTGLLLIRFERAGAVYGVSGGTFGDFVRILHVLTPILVVVLFIVHRSVGRDISWYAGKVSLIWIGAALLALTLLHTQDSRGWLAKATPAGDTPFAPSRAQTAKGRYLPAAALANSDHCAACHTNAHAEWSQSAHRNSSLSNPVYAAAWRAARQATAARGGDVRATTAFCAACHDPVLLFSGALDAKEFADPDYDPAGHPLAGQGITCTVCHGIRHAEPPDGFAPFTIDELPAYPFAYAEHPTLRWLNRQLMFQRPAQHLAAMRNPLHESATFCGACHQKALPDGVAAAPGAVVADDFHAFVHGNFSPTVLEAAHRPGRPVTDCQSCHMPSVTDDRGVARRSHAFADVREMLQSTPTSPPAEAAASAPAVSAGESSAVAGAAPLRVDIFGLRLGPTLNAALSAPLHTTTPRVMPGRSYLLEVVVTNEGFGHAFPAGDAASVEAWLDVTIAAGDRVIGCSGALDDPRGPADPRAHYFGVYAVDRDGRRVDGRNLAAWFATLEDTRVSPGASVVVRYRFEVPAGVSGPITASAAVRMRPRSWEFSREIFGANVPAEDYTPRTLVSDDAMLIAGNAPTASAPATLPAMHAQRGDGERWEDYGRATLALGREVELQQAVEAFAAAEQAGAPDAPIYLAQALLRQERVDEAVAAIERASASSSRSDPVLRELWAGIVFARASDTTHALLRLTSLVESSEALRQTRGYDINADPALHETLAAIAWQHIQRPEVAARDIDYRRGLELARQSARRAVELSPTRRSAAVLLHEISVRTGDDSEAARVEPLLRGTGEKTVDLDSVRSAARDRDPRAAIPPDRIYDLRPPQ
jgi:hypothetical protein